MVVCNYWYLLNWFSSNLFLTEIFHPGVFPRPIPTSWEPGTGYLSNGKVPRHIFPGFESTLCICLYICLLGWEAQGLIALYFEKKRGNFYWELLHMSFFSKITGVARCMAKKTAWILFASFSSVLVCVSAETFSLYFLAYFLAEACLQAIFVPRLRMLSWWWSAFGVID